MSAWRRAAVPLGAALAAAAAAFAAVALATDEDGSRPARASTTTAAAPAPQGDVARGRVVFARMGCGGCHRLSAAGAQGPIGPDLDLALAHHTRGSLLAKITDPGTGSVMPDDFARRMSGADLQALADFLLDARERRR